MKGSNKEFAKYLESEYNDYTLQPHSKNKEKDDPNVLIQYASIQSDKRNSDAPLAEPTKQNVQSLPFQKTSEMIPLTQDIIREFVTLLGEEALDCFQCLDSIQRANNEVTEIYKEFYIKFQTVPIMFLSLVPNKAVYLWQVNRLCPYKKESNHMILDSKAMKSDTKLNISILMLAKIVPEESEEIIGTNFIGESEICVKSKIGDNQLVMRYYRVKDFAELARVNPFKQEILANDKHCYKVIIKKFKDEDGSREKLDITLWKTKSAEELQQEMSDLLKEEDTAKSVPILKENFLLRHDSLDNNMAYILTERCLALSFRTQNGVTVHIDESSATVIAWREDGIFASSYENTMKRIPSYKKMSENHFLMREYSNSDSYELSFDLFPKVEFSSVPEIPTESFRSDSDWHGYNKSISFNKCFKKKNPHFSDSENCVYDVPLSVINPYLSETKTDSKNKDNTEEEKSEQNPAKKIDKIESEFRHNRGTKQHDVSESLKSKEKMLKEIRADISSKMTEINKFDAEYGSDKRNSQQKTSKEPEGVSKKTIELYDEIKTEVKRVEKEREKEKTKKKNNRNRDQDY